MAKTFIFYLHNGATFRASDSFSDGFKRRVQEQGRRDVSHKRVGRFSVTILDDGTMVAAQVYDQRLCDDGSVPPGSRFWRGMVADRTRQLDEIERHVKGHPLEKQILEDIALEREHLRQ